MAGLQPSAVDTIPPTVDPALASTSAAPAAGAGSRATAQPLSARLKGFGDKHLTSWREAFNAQAAGGDVVNVAQLLAAVRGLGYVVPDTSAFELRAARVLDGSGRASYLGFVEVVSEIATEARTVQGVKACFDIVFPGVTTVSAAELRRLFTADGDRPLAPETLDALAKFADPGGKGVGVDLHALTERLFAEVARIEKGKAGGARTGKGGAAGAASAAAATTARPGTGAKS